MRLPFVVASKVLSFLHWHDKLNAVDALPLWDDALATSEAWSDTVYQEDNHRHRYRRKYIDSLQFYGRYIGRLELRQVQLWDEEGHEILRLIGDKCIYLVTLKLDHCLLHLEREGWKLFSKILASCTKLMKLSLIHTDLVCDDDCILVQEKHAFKLQELVLKCDMPQNFADHLAKFTNLQRLRVRRQELSEASLLSLVQQKLSNLSIYQEEEVAFGEPMMFRGKTWRQVIHSKPNFHLTFVLKEIIVIRYEFPSFAPLRHLILVDIAGSLTKGILDTIGQHYHATLQTFVYSNTKMPSTSLWQRDKRLPGGLVELVQNCPKLTTLVYGFELSSTTALFLAGCGHLRQLLIPQDTLVFEVDLTMPLCMNWIGPWSLTFIDWLQSSGSSVRSLQTEISRLLDHEWQPVCHSRWRHLLAAFENM